MVHEHRRGVEPHHLADAGPPGDRPRHRPGPAADLEHAGAVGQRQVAQVVLEHGLLGGLGRPQLEHLHEALQDGLIGGLDARVHDGHGPERA
jgi:hypothetical protein